MRNMDTARNPEQMSESPERQIATAKETAERLKSYGGMLGAVGSFAGKQLERAEKINAFTKTAKEAYNEGDATRVDNMYAHGTQLQKLGAFRATMDRVKGLDNISLKEIVRDQNRGKLERGCAKKTLEIRQETAKAEQDNKKESTDASDKETPTVFNNLEDMKKDLGKTYSEIKEDKPPNSPNISKWFEKGGTIKVEQTDGKNVWTYTDAEGKSVRYIDGKVEFPPEAKHPVIGDLSIGEFTGDRTKDKELYLKKLEEEYGLTEIPDGYALHHDTENGVMQLIKEDYHKEFTHAGGHSMYKEGN